MVAVEKAKRKRDRERERSNINYSILNRFNLVRMEFGHGSVPILTVYIVPRCAHYLLRIDILFDMEINQVCLVFRHIFHRFSFDVAIFLLNTLRLNF